jgi:flagellar biosynthesis/type III secretory pathway protein FliH
MSDAALATPRRIGLADLLRPAHQPSPEARAATREAEAWRRGHEAARAETAEAVAALEAALRESAHRAHAVEQAAAQALAAMQQKLEVAFADSLTTLALGVAKAVLAAEPTLAPATVRTFVDDLVSAVPEGACPRVRVHPDALGPVQAVLPPGWTAWPDSALEGATLVAEVDSSSLTSGLGARLDQLSTLLQATPA